MKLKFIAFASLLASTSIQAQTFSDNFDTYTVGAALGPQSPNWTTWSGTQGGADDVNVTNTDAHSGSNSIYFSSASASGGPADIILPFGGIHGTGTFEFVSWFKIPSGKGGYFNFQGNNTNGNLYTLNTFFTPTGQLNITNTKEQVLSTTYTQGQWIALKLTANLNTNDWELFIDNVSKGKFQCADFTIASIDYFATSTTDAFWVDDVSYTHTPFTMPATDGAVAFINIANGLVTQNRTPSVTIRNLGTNPITSFSLNMNANSVNNSQNFTGLNIASGASYVANLNTPISLIAGLNTFTATISNVNGNGADNDATDDIKTITFTPTTPGADKIVVAEEATGTWCGWCPRGAVMLEGMSNDFDGFFQGIAVHNGDPMTVKIYDSAMGTIISGYPSALVDRLPKIDPSAIKTDFMSRIVLTPVAKLTSGAMYNASTGDLDVSIKTEFKTATSGNYKVACVIVEDSVKGTAAGYNQANYYAGGTNGVMGGFETKANPVPAAQMQYDHVARAIAPDFYGVPNAYPASVSAGAVYAHNFKFNINAWNKNKIHIVGLLIAADGKIENASTASIDKAIANGYVLGINDVKIKPSFASIYPNPTSNQFNLQINAKAFGTATISILDMNGKICMQQKQQVVNGTNIYPIAVKDIAKGQYLISILIGEDMQSLPFVVE